MYFVGTIFRYYLVRTYQSWISDLNMDEYIDYLPEEKIMDAFPLILQPKRFR